MIFLHIYFILVFNLFFYMLVKRVAITNLKNVIKFNTEPCAFFYEFIDNLSLGDIIKYELSQKEQII